MMDKETIDRLKEEYKDYKPDDGLVRQVYDYLGKHMSYGIILPSLIASDLVLPIIPVYHVLEQIKEENKNLEQVVVPRCPHCGSYAYKIATNSLMELPQEITCPDCGTVNHNLFINSIVAYRWRRDIK